MGSNSAFKGLTHRRFSQQARGPETPIRINQSIKRCVPEDVFLTAWLCKSVRGTGTS